MDKDSNLLEINVAESNKSPYELRENLSTTLKPFVNQPITNKNDGRVAFLPSKNIGKLSSEVTISKSKANGFNEMQHYAVAERILELYKNAKLKEIQKDIYNNPDTQIPRYVAIFKLNGEKTQALITLKETLYGMYKGNRLYSIELQEIAKLKPTES